jgi:hypothetical protein
MRGAARVNARRESMIADVYESRRATGEFLIAVATRNVKRETGFCRLSCTKTIHFSSISSKVGVYDDGELRWDEIFLR